MEKYILHSGIIAFIYILMKFVEMRMIKKDKKEVRELIRDTIIVYLSAIVGLYIISEFMPSDSVIKTVTNVFTDAPSF
jgi:TctA family transporter